MVSDFKASDTIQLVDVADMVVQVPHHNVSHTARTISSKFGLSLGQNHEFIHMK